MSTPSPKSDAIAGKLYDLLRSKLPTCCADTGALQVATLADLLKMSHEGVYRWLRSDEISKRGLRRLIELGGAPENVSRLQLTNPPGAATAPLSEDDLRPFL